MSNPNPIPPPTLHPSPEFPAFIESLLRKVGLRKSHRDILLTKECLLEWTKVFTSSGVNPYYNYELYETYGDAISNTIVVWYYKKRFPELFDPTKPMVVTGQKRMAPVGILSRLKQKGIKKETYARYADRLGFRPFVRATEEEILKTRSLLEDAFESFVGCLVNMIDTKISDYLGYGVIFEFMTPLMNEEKISLHRDDLYDQKSILNEDIGEFGPKNFSVQYTAISAPVSSFQDSRSSTMKYVIVKIFATSTGRLLFASQHPGSGYKIQDAEEQAARNARSQSDYPAFLHVLRTQHDHMIANRHEPTQEQLQKQSQRERENKDRLRTIGIVPVPSFFPPSPQGKK